METTIIKKRTQLCKVHLVFSIIIYISVWLFGLESLYGFMLLYGFFSLCIFSLLLKSELRFGGVSLVTLFIAGAYLRLLIPTVTYAISAAEGVCYGFKYDYTDVLFPTTIAMNIYYVAFLLLVTFFSKSNRNLSIDLSVLVKKKNILKYILLLFSLGLLYTVTSISSSIGVLGMFFDNFTSMALVMLAFVCVYKSEKKYLYIFYVLIIRYLHSLLPKTTLDNNPLFLTF